MSTGNQAPCLTCDYFSKIVGGFTLFLHHFTVVCLSSQNGRLGEADIERLKLTDSYINGTQVLDVFVSS